jgi:hypothetical protein
MKLVQHLRNLAANRQQWLGGMLLMLFLSVLALTVSETLHHEVHAEAGEAEHQCAATMLQSGQFEMPAVTVAATTEAPVAWLELAPEINFVRSVELSLPPSCGPPALLS